MKISKSKRIYTCGTCDRNRLTFLWPPAYMCTHKASSHKHKIHVATCSCAYHKRKHVHMYARHMHKAPTHHPCAAYSHNTHTHTSVRCPTFTSHEERLYAHMDHIMIPNKILRDSQIKGRFTTHERYASHWGKNVA